MQAHACKRFEKHQTKTNSNRVLSTPGWSCEILITDQLMRNTSLTNAQLTVQLFFPETGCDLSSHWLLENLLWPNIWFEMTVIPSGNTPKQTLHFPQHSTRRLSLQRLKDVLITINTITLICVTHAETGQLLAWDKTRCHCIFLCLCPQSYSKKKFNKKKTSILCKSLSISNVDLYEQVKVVGFGFLDFGCRHLYKHVHVFVFVCASLFCVCVRGR